MMTEVFADTSFWLARDFPDDQWHQAALAAFQSLGTPLHLFTTQEVLTEYLAGVARNTHRRHIAIDVIGEIHNDPHITVLLQSTESFAKGFDLYRNRLGKGYSLVDCISMNIMDDLDISLILTSDRHFEQENSRYVALMRR